LIIVYPISPRALLLLSDAEVYKVEKNSAGASTLKRRQEVIELNLAQCGNAYENLYFASLARVQATLEAFRKALGCREAAPSCAQRNAVSVRGQSSRRFVGHITAGKTFVHAAKTGKYKLGDGWVRDPARVQVVRELREEATKRAEGEKSE
jgi:hypothetical protein